MTVPRRGPGRTEHLVLPGVLTAEQAAETVARHPRRAARGRRHPVVPRAPPRPVGPHRGRHGAGRGRRARGRRARAYDWLARHQNEDGSWYAAYARRRRRTDATDRGRETNFCAYIAVGVWHHYLATGDDAFLDRMWPAVYAADRVRPGLQQPGGQIGWKREADGTPVNDALLTGSSSVHQALRCALAIAEQREEPQPDWELAAGALAARDPPAPRAVPRQEPLLDGLVLPGPRRRADRRGGQGPYRGGLGPLRRARPRRALRAAQPVGDRRRELPNSPWRSG